MAQLMRKDLGVNERAIGAEALVQLRQTILLGAMDGQQAVEDLRVTEARILLLDQPNHGPDGHFAGVAGGKREAAQALAESPAEAQLLSAGQAGLVEAVVAVRVKQTVGEDRCSQFHGLAEQSLQTASGPGIAEGLDDVSHAQGWVEATRPAGKLRAYRQKAAGKKLYCLRVEVECDRRKTWKCIHDPLPRQKAFTSSAGSPARLSLKGAQGLVVGSLALALFFLAVAWTSWEEAPSAALPRRGGLRALRLDPRPTVAVFHAEEGYESLRPRVPCEILN